MENNKHTWPEEVLSVAANHQILSHKFDKDTLWLDVNPNIAPQIAKSLQQTLALNFLAMVGCDDRDQGKGYRLHYLFTKPKSGYVVFTLTLPDEKNPTYSSWTPFFPACNWYEREVKDLLGLVPSGHPDQRSLILHDCWPQDFYPLRKDTQVTLIESDSTPSSQPFAYERPNVPGSFQIPVGPIHAGIIEPGHFRFTSVGEAVSQLEARLFYTHRGIEKWCEGKTVHQGLNAAERLCGVCSFSHGLAYVQALEKLQGIQVSYSVDLARVIFIELERLYNHLGDIGNICAGTGLALGNMEGNRLKELVQVYLHQTTGSRFIRGALRIGGLNKVPALAALSKLLQQIKPAYLELRKMLTLNPGFNDRIIGTGILTRDTAMAMEVVGVAARASNIARDARIDDPYSSYKNLPIRISLQGKGDVASRLDVRFEEIENSIEIIESAINSINEQDLISTFQSSTKSMDCITIPPGISWGIIESPRGETVHWIEIDEDKLIRRYRVRSASYANWPAVPSTVPGNIVPDFPLINKSFELCYSCCDR